MKGRKNRITEEYLHLKRSLEQRFPEQLHLVAEFIRDREFRATIDPWLGLTEAGIAKLFEDFIAPPDFKESQRGSGEEPDSIVLLSASNNLRLLAHQLETGSKVTDLQRRLKNEIIGELEKINLKWIRVGMV